MDREDAKGRGAPTDFLFLSMEAGGGWSRGAPFAVLRAFAPSRSMRTPRSARRHFPSGDGRGRLDAMLILLLNTAAVGMLIGLIWTIQLVHYPLLARVGAAELPAYIAEHQARITVLVGPWMLLELVTAALLALRPPAGADARLAWAGAALVGVIWASTALWQGPLVAKLGAGWDPVLHRELVLSNWLRTAAWTARGTLLLVLLWQVLGPRRGG